MHTFKSKMQKMGEWVVAITPIDVRKIFGTGGYVRVKGTVDGFSFDDISLMPMKTGEHLMAIRYDIRKAIKKKVGDTIEVVLEQDFDELKVSEELIEAFEASEEAKRMFDALAPSHQRMYTRHINDSKYKETREIRAVKIVLDLEKRFFEKGLPKKKTKKNSI